MLNLAMVIEDSAFKAGAVVVPLNSLLSAPEFAYHLKDSDALRAWSRARSDLTERANFLSGVPTMYWAMLTTDRDRQGAEARSGRRGGARQGQLKRRISGG
ncbi:MAG: hypothetical protein ACHQ1E_09595 [Ktedonobacterales bacterium]